MNRTDQLTMRFHECNTMTNPDVLMSLMEEMVHHMAELQDDVIRLSGKLDKAVNPGYYR